MVRAPVLQPAWGSTPCMEYAASQLIGLGPIWCIIVVHLDGSLWQEQVWQGLRPGSAHGLQTQCRDSSGTCHTGTASMAAASTGALQAARHPSIPLKHAGLPQTTCQESIGGALLRAPSLPRKHGQRPVLKSFGPHSSSWGALGGSFRHHQHYTQQQGQFSSRACATLSFHPIQAVSRPWGKLQASPVLPPAIVPV